jgi:hypothetical protein
MFWLDRSSTLPFVPYCSYIMSNSRTRAFAQAQGLIEDRPLNLKFSIETKNFKYWCHCAQELVELMIDLDQRDKKYLHRDGLSTHEEGLHQISDLNSQIVNLNQKSDGDPLCEWIIHVSGGISHPFRQDRSQV